MTQIEEYHYIFYLIPFILFAIFYRITIFTLQTNSNTNKILDFKTGEYIDYNEYLLKNVDMKYFA